MSRYSKSPRHFGHKALGAVKNAFSHQDLKDKEPKGKFAHKAASASEVRRVEGKHGTLSYEERQELPSADFALPDQRRYPIPNEAHARNALSRVSLYGTPEEKRKVRVAVAARFPEIEQHSEVRTHMTERDKQARAYTELYHEQRRKR